jgi:hypothetical protein
VAERIEFQIVSAGSAKDLGEKIGALLNEGWVRDGPFHTHDWSYYNSGHKSGTTYMQPMVKTIPAKRQVKP